MQEREREFGGLWVVTFGAGEEEVVSAVDAEDGLAVTLGHVDALQRRRATAFGGRNRVDDTPGKQTGTHTHGRVSTGARWTQCRLGMALNHSPRATGVMLSVQLNTHRK